MSLSVSYLQVEDCRREDPSAFLVADLKVARAASAGRAGDTAPDPGPGRVRGASADARRASAGSGPPSPEPGRAAPGPRAAPAAPQQVPTCAAERAGGRRGGEEGRTTPAAAEPPAAGHSPAVAPEGGGAAEGPARTSGGPGASPGPRLSPCSTSPGAGGGPREGDLERPCGAALGRASQLGWRGGGGTGRAHSCGSRELRRAERAAGGSPTPAQVGGPVRAPGRPRSGAPGRGPAGRDRGL